jgi:hypothetical protein
MHKYIESEKDNNSASDQQQSLISYNYYNSTYQRDCSFSEVGDSEISKRLTPASVG